MLKSQFHKSIFRMLIFFYYSRKSFMECCCVLHFSRVPIVRAFFLALQWSMTVLGGGVCVQQRCWVVAWRWGTVVLGGQMEGYCCCLGFLQRCRKQNQGVHEAIALDIDSDLKECVDEFDTLWPEDKRVFFFLSNFIFSFFLLFFLYFVWISYRLMFRDLESNFFYIVLGL